MASSFILSDEFKIRYGDALSNDKYVQSLYLNVFDRNPDQIGFNYWVDNLNNGVEQRYEVLIGFSESVENKNLFSEVTSIY